MNKSEDTHPHTHTHTHTLELSVDLKEGRRGWYFGVFCPCKVDIDLWIAWITSLLNLMFSVNMELTHELTSWLTDWLTVSWQTSCWLQSRSFHLSASGVWTDYSFGFQSFITCCHWFIKRTIVAKQIVNYAEIPEYRNLYCLQNKSEINFIFSCFQSVTYNTHAYNFKWFYFIFKFFFLVVLIW